MRNSPQNWVAAATVAASLLDAAGCKHSEAPTKPARPVAQVPEVPDTQNETTQAVQNVLEEAPQPEVSTDKMITELSGEQEKESSAPDEAMRNAASQKLFTQYFILLNQLNEKNSARTRSNIANYNVDETRKIIAELGKLSTPEFSPDDLDQLRVLLIKEKMYFVIIAKNASNATPYFEKCEVNADYPQLSLSDDKTVATFTVLLHSTFGPTMAMEMPHDVTVSIKITKRGVDPRSVTITNAYPAIKGDFSPKSFENGCAEIFGSIQLPTEEEKPE